jgi:RNA polymerase sigma factor (sigma-70 family)
VPETSSQTKSDEALPSQSGERALSTTNHRPLQKGAIADLLAFRPNHRPPSPLTTIFQTQYDQLLRYCHARIRNHADAEDIVQDAFLSVRRAYQDKPADELRALLFTTVRNLTVNYLKSGRVRHQGRSDDIGELEDQIACQRTVTPEQKLMDAQQLAIADEAIAGMPPRKRDALRMHRIEGLTYDAIARRLSVSPTTVKTDIAEAIAEIAERLAAAGGGAPGQGR